VADTLLDRLDDGGGTSLHVALNQVFPSGGTYIVAAPKEGIQFLEFKS
jgi:hypothetical protein